MGSLPSCHASKSKKRRRRYHAENIGNADRSAAHETAANSQLPRRTIQHEFESMPVSSSESTPGMVPPQRPAVHKPPEFTKRKRRKHHQSVQRENIQKSAHPVKPQDMWSFVTLPFLFFAPQPQVVCAFPVGFDGPPSHDTRSHDDDTVWMMRNERNRVASFHYCPQFHQRPLHFSPLRLAGDGFCYNDVTGFVHCYYCRQVVDVGGSRHHPRRHISSCDWRAANVPFGHVDSDTPIPYRIFLGMMGARPHVVPDYGDRQARLDSFRIYRRRDDCTELADAGFFARDAETLECFACGLQPTRRQLQGHAEAAAHNPHNNALNAHAVLAPRCPFVLAVYPRQNSNLAGPQRHAGRTVGRGMCCTCGNNPADVVLQPCEHLVICFDCAAINRPRHCPQCGAAVQNVCRVCRQ